MSLSLIRGISAETPACGTGGSDDGRRSAPPVTLPVALFVFDKRENIQR